MLAVTFELQPSTDINFGKLPTTAGSTLEKFRLNQDSVASVPTFATRHRIDRRLPRPLQALQISEQMTIAETNAMNRLPHDIVLVVLENLDIDSFLDFRLTCRMYRSLIDSHMNSLAPAVARSTFPYQRRIHMMQLDKDDSGDRFTLRWLKWLRYQQLAAITVERHRGRPISAEDPLGDTARSAVACGWHVIEHLGRLAEQVERDIMAEQTALSSGSEATSSMEAPATTRTRQPPSRQLAAEAVCHRWLRFVQTWTLAEFQGYEYIMDTLVHDMYAFPVTGPRGLRVDGEWDCVAWLVKRIIGLGPRSFWHMLWPSATLPTSRDGGVSEALAARIELAWISQQSPISAWDVEGVRVIEQQIQYILDKVRRIMKEGFSKQNPGPKPYRGRVYWSSNLGYVKAAKERAARTEAGEETSPMLFDSVPFDQHLDWQLLGYEPQDHDKGRRRGPRNQGCGIRIHPWVSHDFESIFVKWQYEWSQSCSID